MGTDNLENVLETLKQNLKTITNDVVQQARDQLKTYKANLAAIQTFSSDNIGANNLERLKLYLTQPNPSNHEKLASNLATINKKYLEKLLESSEEGIKARAEIALRYNAQADVSNTNKRRFLQEIASEIRAKRDDAARDANAARAARGKS